MSFPPDGFGPVTDTAAAVAYCAVCHKRRLRGDEIMTCGPCVQRLDEALADIVELFALLPTFVLPGSVPMSDLPHGKQVDAPAPVRLEILDHLDDRIVDQPGDIQRRGIIGVLEQWSRLVAEEQRFSPRPGRATVATEVGFLRTHLKWATEQPWVDEFADEIAGARGIHRQLQAAVGETRPKPIGQCPATVVREGQPTACGAALYAPVYGDTVTCNRCGEMWTKDRWLWLGNLLKENEGA